MTYATTAQALTYHSARLSASAWSAIPVANQPLALQSAADVLDAYAAANGGWKDFDPAGIVPAPLVAACCELAILLADTATQERIKAQRQGLTSLSIGSASESYAAGANAKVENVLDPRIKASLRPYLNASGGGVHII